MMGLERIVQLWSGIRGPMHRESVPVAESLVAELNHKINSPLAAIRNALYLAACRTADPELHRYLQLANEEITSIAEILRAALPSSCGKTPPRSMAAAAGCCLERSQSSSEAVI